MIPDNLRTPSEKFSKQLDDYSSEKKGFLNGRTVSVSEDQKTQIVASEYLPKEEKVSSPKTLNQKIDYERFSMKLSSTPQLPVRSNKIDKEKLNVWINQHPPEIRDDIRILAESIKHISTDEFFEQLNLSLESLENVLDKTKSYVFAGSENKSNQWVTEHVLQIKSHSFSPVDIISLDRVALRKALRNQPDQIVLFDDATYSGSQLTDHFKDIVNTIVQAKCPTPSIYIVPIFNTSFAKENILKAFEEYFSADSLLWLRVGLKELSSEKKDLFKQSFVNKLHFVEGKKIETLDEVIPDRNVKERLNKIYYASNAKLPSGLSADDTTISGLNAKGLESRGCVYFDFKIPDRLSFPEYIHEGWVVNEEGSVLNPENPLKIIPATIQPYHPSFKDFVECIRIES